MIAAIKNQPHNESYIKNKFRDLGKGNYVAFSSEERHILLSYLATRVIMNGDWWGKENEESFAIHIIENTPENQIKEALFYLKQKPLDPLNELAPVYEKKSLVYVLDNKISDGILGSSIGGDNNTKAKICLCNLVFKSNPLSSNIIATTNPPVTPLIKDCYINLYQATNANDVQQTIYKLKEAINNNISLSISDLPLPESIYDLKRVEKVELGGNSYQFIQLEVESQALHNKKVITVKNRLQKVVRTTLYGSKLYGVTVDGVVYFIVSSEQEQDNLFNYINNPFNLSSKTLLLFVNGYRNSMTVGFEKQHMEQVMNSSNVVSRIEPFLYWNGMDKNFIERLNTGNVWYADGHASITTSNHNVWGGAATGQLGFTGNMIHSASSGNLVYATLALHPDWYHDFDRTLSLHTEANVEGFNTRRQSGKIAGEDIIRKIKNGTMLVERDAQGLITSKLDIVAHSMGYAYALGIVDAIKGSDVKIQMGRFYIIAPENACSGQISLSDFEEVWQYGSNLGQPGADPLWEQDGVAPQCAVQGLNTPSSTRGRAYFPANWKPKGFVESHSISNYGWIFNTNKGETGYVNQR